MGKKVRKNRKIRKTINFGWRIEEREGRTSER